MPKQDQGIDVSLKRQRFTVIPRTLVFITRGDHVLLLRGSAQKRIWANKYNGIGGHIERDPVTREPTGTLRESATRLVARGLPHAEVFIALVHHGDEGFRVAFVNRAASMSRAMITPGTRKSDCQPQKSSAALRRSPKAR